MCDYYTIIVQFENIRSILEQSENKSRLNVLQLYNGDQPSPPPPYSPPYYEIKDDKL